MKLQNMFKKTSVRAHYISLKNARPEVPAGLLRKCNKCGAAIIAEDVKTDIISVRNATGISVSMRTGEWRCWRTKAPLKSGIRRWSLSILWISRV